MVSMNKYKKNDFVIDFIGIGAPKSATTWVYRCLLEHPSICGPYQKELNYFCTKDFLFWKESVKDSACRGNNKSIEQYKKYFSHCAEEMLKGEFSVYYLNDSGAAKLIQEHFPDVKLIACLRDPVDRAYSLYWYAKKYLLAERSSSFESAIKENENAYIDSGKYYKHLKNYYDLFPSKNIKVIFVDDLKTNPIGVMGDLYAFLNVSSEFVAPSINIKKNSSKQTRFRWLRKLIESISSVSLFFKKIKLYFIIDLLRKLRIESLIFYVLNKLNVVSFVPPKMNPETEKALRVKFRGDIENLEKLLKRDLSAWK